MCMLTAHLKSRNPGALPVRPYTYRVFAAESSRSSNIPTFLAAAVSVRARCVCLSLSLARARVCVWCRLTLCHCSGHSALCAHALLKCQQLSRLVSGGSGVVCTVLWSCAPQLHRVCVHTVRVPHTLTQQKLTPQSLCAREARFFQLFGTHFSLCALSHTTRHRRAGRDGAPAAWAGRARGRPRLKHADYYASSIVHRQLSYACSRF